MARPFVSRIGAHAKALFCAVTFHQVDVNVKSRMLATHIRPSQPLRASQSPFTSLTFPHGYLFCHGQPCEVISAVISLRFGETESLTSLTSGRGERESLPDLEKSEWHWADVASGSWKRVKNCRTYLFCWFLTSKRANAFSLHVRAMQTVKAPS